MTQPEAHAHLCKNCQTPLQGDYCHQCGQQDKQYIRSIFAVVGDLFGEIGHWDSRFYRTLRSLFLSPGFLSQEFVRGRHASYVPPLRLYFFVSLISFMVFNTFIEFEVKKPTEKEQEIVERVQQEMNESFSDEGMAPPSLDKLDLPLLDEEDEALLRQKFEHMIQSPDQLSRKLVSMTPQMMLLMLPFWALFLKLIYCCSHRYYLEHLTVALHTHAFILLTLMLMTLVGSALAPLAALEPMAWLKTLKDWVSNGILVWIVVYLLITQKRFYQQAWPVTVAKFLLSGVVYFGLLTTSFVIMVIIGILSS